MNVSPVPRPEQGNPLYPLPPDYHDLDLQGQREARVNACRQGPLPGTPTERAQALIESVRFFDLYYLVPDPDTGFDPLFYDEKPRATPEFHYDILGLWATSRTSLTVCPRGSAKTFLCRKDMGLRLLSRPGYSLVYATSTHDNARMTGQIMKDLVFENQRVFDDWSPEYEFSGKIKPSRGDAPTGAEFFYLNNGSWLRCMSANSFQRGMRPRRYRLDDPEFDPKASTSMCLIREYMDQLLFKIIMPMVMRADCGVEWLATFVSRRHFAWKAMQVREVSGQRVSFDPRFNYWSRMIVKAAYEQEGKLVSCWPEMWPATQEEKDVLVKAGQIPADTVTLPEIRERVGTPNFNSEYLASPGSGEDSFFPEVTEPLHGYTLSGVDPNLEGAPRESTSQIVWQRKGEEVRLPLKEFLGKAYLFITCDTSYGEKVTSDYKASVLMAYLQEHNELFVLDMWAKQASEESLVQATFKMADKWKVPLLCPEVIKESVSLFNSIQSIIRTRATEHMGLAHVPGVRPIRPGMEEKTSKISSLQLRFEHGLIKIPLWKRDQPPWYMLYDQIEGFNPEAADGGLENDDIIDCVAMSKFVIRGRLVAQPDEPVVPRDALELLLAGETEDSLGAPLGTGINWLQVDPRKIGALITKSTPVESSSKEPKM